LALALFATFTQASRQVQAEEVQVFSWHKRQVTGLAFTPDGTRLVSTSLSDDRISTMVPEEGASSSIGDSVGAITGARSHAVAISPDGTQVAIAGFKETAMYDLKTRNQQWQIDTSNIYKHPPTVKALAFSPDGKLLATYGNGGRISIRNAETGEEIHRFEGGVHIPAGLVSFCNDGIAFSPDGKLFAAGSFGKEGEGSKPGELRIWDAEKGKLMHVWKTKESVQDGKDNAAIHGIAFSPDSRRIAIACSDGDVWIWDIATKQVSEKLKGHRSRVRRVTFSPDGRHLASAGRDHTVRLWSTESWKQLASLPVDLPEISALRFSPDGNSLVAGGADALRSGAGEVRIWDLVKLIQK
jgi:WD40 repeat protein